jgi:hypothetical protein
LKGTWGVINDTIKPLRGGGTRGIEKLVDNIANKFNEHFSSIGGNISRSFAGDVNDHVEYMSGNFQNSFFFSPIGSSDVNNIIMSLKNKSCNVDCLPAIVLKTISNIISPVLASLVNRSLSTGVFPDLLKLARVIPIPKGGSKVDVNNY